MSIFPQLEIKLPDFSLILKYYFPLTVSWPVTTLGVVNWVHSYRQVGMKKMSDKLPNFFWSARCCLLIYRLKNKELSQPHLCPIFATLRIVWTRLFYDRLSLCMNARWHTLKVIRGVSSNHIWHLCIKIDFWCLMFYCKIWFIYM